MSKQAESIRTSLYATVALMSSASALQAAVVFDQDFNNNGTVSSYVSSTPNSAQFNDITGDGTINSVAVSGGQLRFDMEVDPNGSTPPNPNSGLLRSTELATPVPTLLSMQLTFTYARDDAASNSGPGPALQIGDYPSTATNYASSVSADRFDDILFRRNGASSFWVELSTTERVSASFGSEVVLTYFLNDSGAAANFVGPDNITYTLNNDSVAAFVNNTLIANNHAAQNGSSSDLSTFRIVALDGSDTSFAINRILVRDDFAIIPEPASLSLVALAAGFIARRRRV